MAVVRPLRLRLVRPGWAERVASPAHDALTPADRRAHLAMNPDSYLAVTRGIEDVAPGEASDADLLLSDGRAALDRLRQNGAFGAERPDHFYVYELEAAQTLVGLVGGVSVQDYTSGVVRIHEHVKAQRAIHLANHLDTVGVQSSPIALAHRPDDRIDGVVDRVRAGEPELTVALDDGLTQRIWPIEDPDDIAGIAAAFVDRPLYLVDGHHRAAAAATFRTAAGPGMAEWMLCALFPSDQLTNAPHHRVLRLPGGASEVMRTIGRAHRVRRVERDDIESRSPEEIPLFADGAWCLVSLPLAGERLDDLDPIRFHRHIVTELLHLDPERDGERIDYLAGSRTLTELESAIGEGDVLALMRTVPVDALLAAADAGRIMPPKSTYFEPKARSGVFLRSTT